MPGVMQEDLGALTSHSMGVGVDDQKDPNRDFDEDGQQRQDQARYYVRIFRDFILLFKSEDQQQNEQYYYREQLRRNIRSGKYYLEVDYDDILGFDKSLADELRNSPIEVLPNFEAAALATADYLACFDDERGTLRKDIQVELYWNNDSPTDIRSVMKGSNNISVLVCMPAMVVKCMPVRQKVVEATIVCKDCKGQHKCKVPAGAFSVPLPARCMNAKDGSSGDKCRPNPYEILPTQSSFIDTQTIKLQEMHETVPSGELPRHVQLSVDRQLVDKVSPGQRVLVVAINQIYHDAVKEKGRKAAGIRRRYLKCVGLMTQEGGAGSGQVRSINKTFSQLNKSGTLRWDKRDEAKFKALAQRETLYEDIAMSIAPSISGHPDIKKAIACMLFGGSRKMLKDGGKLRGDMNVLLVGDPSTGKSQMLKFAHEVAPIGVYTSGKGSSAAGLTAAVVREGGKSHGDFYLEGGSMVLADGGMVCIDEFDKMRDSDTVAIHEAMEQQTISIAKAGLNCVLNSRTSVLAAANPIDGCYDASKTNEEQMNFKATVLSRFDLIFKVLDPAEEEKDRRIARHIFGIYKQGSGGAKNQKARPTQAHRCENAAKKARLDGAKPASESSSIAPRDLRSYIAWCRAQCRPRLNADAEERIKNFYVVSRKDAFEAQKNIDTAQRGAIQLTVRQLEALIRITESIAKMRFADYATGADADEAIRLLKVATVDAIKSGICEHRGMNEEAIDKCKEEISRMCATDTTIQVSRVEKSLKAKGIEPWVISRTLDVLCKTGQIVFTKKRQWMETRMDMGGS